ncbi:MAG: HAD-IA family hydrolase [Theionarchaea archaeon]|nr:MAG: hypothetical protein AYK19_05090 [Theionarchaea archaeon DG-70-1]MBU7030218.1 HAD-IA family hydrolase [Theionarchaea archaeon]
MDVVGVFFDLGGTLVWPEPPGEVLFCEASQLIGFQVSPCDLLKVIADIDRQIYVPLPITRKQEADFFAYGNMMALRKLGFEATLSHGWFIHHYIHDRIQYHKFYDVDKVLSPLKGAGLKLGLVSNAVPSTRDKISALALDTYFDTIVLSGEVGYEKPDPEIFETALETLSLTPEETVHVGDNYHADVEGAHKVGITPVLLDRADRYHDVSCIKVKNLTEFKELIHIFK